MRKLRLDLDALAVESFATDAAAAARGTVGAHAALAAPTADRTCLAPTQGEQTCDGNYSCGVCAYTGHASCGVDCNYTLDCVSVNPACEV